MVIEKPINLGAGDKLETQASANDDVDVFASGSVQVLRQIISTNGYPTSNKWKTNLEGSFFNNFDNTTHVSEILRFMSGVLSHSLRRCRCLTKHKNICKCRY